MAARIYTRTGDSGETGLIGGARVEKDDPRVEAYGAIDELNSHIGWVLSQECAELIRTELVRVQSELFDVGAELASPKECQSSHQYVAEAIHAGRIAELESLIDAMEVSLEPLRNFVLPGGCLAASALHIARTSARRAERQMVSLHRIEPVRPDLLRYINRLSDVLFVMARFANHAVEVPDVPWVPAAQPT